MEVSRTVEEILSMIKSGLSIPINDICAAARTGTVTRKDLEARIVDAGYFYAIGWDSYMPPEWLDHMRRVHSQGMEQQR